MVFAIEDSPVYMLGGFDLMAAMLDNQPKVEPAFKTGGGVAWGDQTSCLFCAVARFFRPGYHNNLVSNWLPALDGVVDKLQRGAKVADVGCGHGWSTVMMAKAFPNSQFVGYDFHPSSIEHAAAHADEHGVTANARFEVGTAKDYPEKDFDLVDLLRLPARHGRSGRRRGACPAVAEAGRLVDDRRADGRRPARRQSEPGRPDLLRRSTMICVPTSLSQEVGAALGAQAGEAKLREVITAGGFRNVRRATETPFNMILEARP